MYCPLGACPWCRWVGCGYPSVGYDLSRHDPKQGAPCVFSSVTSQDAGQCLAGKTVWFMGDSTMRQLAGAFVSDVQHSGETEKEALVHFSCNVQNFELVGTQLCWPHATSDVPRINQEITVGAAPGTQVPEMPAHKCMAKYKSFLQTNRRGTKIDHSWDLGECRSKALHLCYKRAGTTMCFRWLLHTQRSETTNVNDCSGSNFLSLASLHDGDPAPDLVVLNHGLHSGCNQ